MNSMYSKLDELRCALFSIRVPIVDPSSRQATALERLQARRLSAYLPLRLSELAATPNDLAKALDIEREFIDTLLDGTFPLSILSMDLWRELASFLQCTVAALRQVIAGSACLPDTP